MKGCRMLGWLLRPFPHCRREVSEPSDEIFSPLHQTYGVSAELEGGKLSTRKGSMPSTPSTKTGRSMSPVDSPSTGQREGNILESKFEDGESDHLGGDKCGRNAMQKQPREHDEDGKKQGDRDQKLKHKESQQRRRDLRQRPDRTRAPRSRQKPTPTAPPSLDSSPLHMASLEAKAKAKVRKPVRAKPRTEDVLSSEDESSFWSEDCSSEHKWFDLVARGMQERRERLRFICIQGLGKRRFEVALKLLQCLQRGDRKVLHDGVEYDGKEGKQVQALMTKILGRSKLGYLGFLEELSCWSKTKRV